MPATGDLIVTVPGLAPGAYTVAIQTAAYDGHLAAASTTVLTVASATAPPLASSTPHGTVRAATAAGSSSVTVTAGGYTPGELVVFYLHSDPIFLGTAFAGADGVATLTAVLPATAPAGAHHVRAIGGTSGVWAEVPITLAAGGTVAAAGAPSLATLPATGSPASSGVLTALALIAVGTALTVARRRIAGVSRL
ncbi:LPXTG cell wall anchor domain-containing protein [Cellulomonas timonensis]|uniref:LPXTG cell wall anchor domain-containing protein n=1 Tax=Cellulomonas timonensis TaxID=1689271 RepID=UPI000B1E9469|nr:LPXTG cell wall anchor domain-containing protein [Cellulomonas timonensis]